MINAVDPVWATSVLLDLLQIPYTATSVLLDSLFWLVMIKTPYFKNKKHTFWIQVECYFIFKKIFFDGA